MVLKERGKCKATPKMAVQKFLVTSYKSVKIQCFKIKLSIMKIYLIMFISRSYCVLLIFCVASLSLNNCFNVPGGVMHTNSSPSSQMKISIFCC